MPGAPPQSVHSVHSAAKGGKPGAKGGKSVAKGGFAAAGPAPIPGKGQHKAHAPYQAYGGGWGQGNWNQDNCIIK